MTMPITSAWPFDPQWTPARAYANGHPAAPLVHFPVPFRHLPSGFRKVRGKLFRHRDGPVFAAGTTERDAQMAAVAVAEGGKQEVEHLENLVLETAEAGVGFDIGVDRRIATVGARNSSQCGFLRNRQSKTRSAPVGSPDGRKRT
jgi:hypothetical protein